MEPVTVGIREFRENLASYLLESQGPVAITRHGDTIGYYIPARRKRTEAERAALEKAATRLADVLAARGVTEDELVVDFKKWRAAKRKTPEKGLALRRQHTDPRSTGQACARAAEGLTRTR
jgi:PHD/YefM family antitoxin component YafN of YafNO toxin-antitoxin module